MLKLLKPKSLKKKIKITGQLLYPAEVGMPAMIQESAGFRITSAVQKIAMGDSNPIIIETQNTIYILMRGEET